MNSFQRSVALRVLGIHVAVILCFMMIAGLKGCFRPKPKPEIVTFIEFGQPAPPVQVEEMANEPEPEPEPQPEPAPEPEPKPVPKPLPKPKPIPKPAPKPEPMPEPKKKEWKPTPVDQIKRGKKIKAEPAPKPVVSETEISKALSGISKKTGPVGNPDAIAAYDAHIYTVFYNAWSRPSSAAARPAKVTLSISSAGRVLSSRLSQSSGDADFDASVMTAVRSVKVLPKKPPAGYPLDNIVVQFRIID